MVTIAVTGASGLVGRWLLPALADEPSVSRIVAIDVRDPDRRVRALESHRADVTRSELKPLLEGVDVLVHLAAIVDPVPDEALMTRVNLEGTRRVLDAAAAVGVSKVVRVSSAAVYGAWANNPVPLTEDAPLRPNPGFTPAVQAAEVERLLAEWRDDHPGTVVTVLRTAPVLGPGAERLPSRLLLGRPRLRVRGAAPPVQATHVEDLVRALSLVVLQDHAGTFNVASTGWLEPGEVAALVAAPRLPPLPAELLERVLDRTWRSGLGEIPPDVVPYLVHPWVVSTDRLEAIGWRARHSNEEAIRDGVDTLTAPRSRRGPLLVALAAVAVGLLLVIRRRRGARRARRPTRS